MYYEVELEEFFCIPFRGSEMLNCGICRKAKEFKFTCYYIIFKIIHLH